MPPLQYVRARDTEHALSLLQSEGAAALGGGTDLLVAMREGISRVATMVDLRSVHGADAIERLPDGGLRIGAAARLARIAADPTITVQVPALAQSCDAVGSPALRNMGTLGGNLCQRPRCWYLRAGLPCHKNGGDACPAVDGENQYHAIVGGGPCHIVHPSDPAVALVALEAVVEVVGPQGTRRVPAGEFYVLPSVRLDHETVLQAGEFVTAVEIPDASLGGRQRYEKVMQRGAWDFALASLAVVRRRDGAVRLVLGGVAPVPWRVNPSVEEDIASGGIAEEDLEALADRALHDARPLTRNAYKVALAGTLLRSGMAFAAG